MRSLVVSVAKQLRAAGVGNAEQEARWLVEHAESAATGDWLGDAVRRRCDGEPLAYIVGQVSFHGLRGLRVCSDVLIPRFETEQLVDLVLDTLSAWPRPPRVLDVGTGSGAVALSLARAMPGLPVFATDVCPRALRLAEDNARLQGLDHAVAFLPPSSLLDHAVAARLSFDVLVANLPYVSRLDEDSLAPHVRLHEPHLALFTDDPLGLDLIRALVAQAPLVSASTLWTEHGCQPQVVHSLATLPSYKFTVNDLTDRPRFSLFQFNHP